MAWSDPFGLAPASVDTPPKGLLALATVLALPIPEATHKLVAGLAIAALAAAGAAGLEHSLAGTSVAAESGPSPQGTETIAFGQARISPGFADGATITGGALAILGGARPPVQVTRAPDGTLSALNNRTLAAYGIAGVRPTNLIFRPFGTLTPGEQARFAEPGVPNYRIPVTIGNQTLFHVNAPQ